MHYYCHTHPPLNDQLAQIPFAEATFDGGKAAREALMAESVKNLELHRNGQTPFTLEDLVWTFWRNLEKKIEVFDEDRQQGISIGPKRVKGWETMDLIYDHNEPQYHDIQDSSRGWPLLAKDVMVFYCSQLGDILTPSGTGSSCNGSLTIPRGQDYMMASLACIGSLSQARRIPDNPYVKLSHLCGWRPNLNCGTMGHDDSTCGQQDSHYLQQISEYTPADITRKSESEISQARL